MTNNSNTISEEEPSEDSELVPPITIFHLSNDTIVIGRIVGTSKEIVSLHFPLQLRTFFSSNGDFGGFSTMPYLLPFVEIDGKSVVNFSVSQIASFASPSKELKENYLSILYNALNRKESPEIPQSYSKDFDLANMEISGVAH